MVYGLRGEEKRLRLFFPRFFKAVPRFEHSSSVSGTVEGC